MRWLDAEGRDGEVPDWAWSAAVLIGIILGTTISNGESISLRALWIIGCAVSFAFLVTLAYALLARLREGPGTGQASGHSRSPAPASSTIRAQGKDEALLVVSSEKRGIAESPPELEVVIRCLVAYHEAVYQMGDSGPNLPVIVFLARKHLSLLALPWLIAEGIRVARHHKEFQYEIRSNEFVTAYRAVTNEGREEALHSLDLMFGELPGDQLLSELSDASPIRPVVTAATAVVRHHLDENARVDSRLDEVWRWGEKIYDSIRQEKDVPTLRYRRRSWAETREYARERDRCW